MKIKSCNSTTKTTPLSITIPAYIPVRGVPREEYADFVGQSLPMCLVIYDLESGNYPPGPILQDHTGAYQVFGEQGKPQAIYPLVQRVLLA